MTEHNSALETIDEVEERGRLLDLLQDIEVATMGIVEYPRHSTVEEGKLLRGDLPGTFTKNLLLKDRKGQHYFVTAHEDTAVDLKKLHTRVGGRGQLRFSSPEAITEWLRVRPGAVTPLALMNDKEDRVVLVVDEQLVGREMLNFHPMVQTESIGLSWDDFYRYACSINHEPLVVNLET